MKRLFTRALVVLALASVMPVHAWGKKLPEPRHFNDGKEEQGVSHLSVVRPVPRRIQGQNWGRSTFVNRGSGRGVSSSFITN